MIPELLQEYLKDYTPGLGHIMQFSVGRLDIEFRDLGLVELGNDAIWRLTIHRKGVLLLNLSLLHTEVKSFFSYCVSPLLMYYLQHVKTVSKSQCLDLDKFTII